MEAGIVCVVSRKLYKNNRYLEKIKKILKEVHRFFKGNYSMIVKVIFRLPPSYKKREHNSSDLSECYEGTDEPVGRIKYPVDKTNKPYYCINCIIQMKCKQFPKSKQKN